MGGVVSLVESIALLTLLKLNLSILRSFSFSYLSLFSFSVFFWKSGVQELTHFRFTLCLCLRMSLRAKPVIWKRV